MAVEGYTVLREEKIMKEKLPRTTVSLSFGVFIPLPCQQGSYGSVPFIGLEIAVTTRGLDASGQVLDRQECEAFIRNAFAGKDDRYVDAKDRRGPLLVGTSEQIGLAVVHLLIRYVGATRLDSARIVVNPELHTRAIVTYEEGDTEPPFLRLANDAERFRHERYLKEQPRFTPSF